MPGLTRITDHAPSGICLGTCVRVKVLRSVCARCEFVTESKALRKGPKSRLQAPLAPEDGARSVEARVSPGLPEAGRGRAVEPAGAAVGAVGDVSDEVAVSLGDAGGSGA